MRFLVCMSISALLLTALAGCGGGSGGSSSLQLFITDAPIDAEAINVAITKIEVHSEANGWVTLKEYSPALQLNLMDFQAKFDQDDDPSTVANYLLLDVPLTAGHYTMVRLFVESVDVVIDGQTHPVDLNNLDQTGIKLNHEFDVAQGGAAALLLDFNGKESIVETGNGSYKLQPIIAMVPKNIVGGISGSLAFKDAAAAAFALSEGSSVTVQAYTAGTTTLVNSAAATLDEPTRTTATFTIGALLPGTYDIKVVIVPEQGGYSADTVRLAGVTLGVAEAKNVGEIVVTPP
ncbi:MAG: DUF4382 domain-containing protein [Armatimonadota bacterium]|nr:DUF4382 domain-containing protein [Armatimonadota bacterium]